MNRVILIKYGELTTKKGNRNFFIKTLKKNIEHKLRKYQVTIVNDNARMYIYFNDEDIDKITSIMDNIFGVHMYHVAVIANTNVESIFDTCIKALSSITFKKFKVETKRSDKSFEFDSPTFSKMLGGHILKNFTNISVDVHNPDILVQVEIRKEQSYIYFSSHKGLGGYPVGTQPKGLLMLSGGIDSPVAGYLAMKRGVKIEAIYFESPPHTSFQAKNKVESLARILSTYNQDIKLHIIKFTEIQEAIYKNIPHEYLITIMRRMMYRICAIVASKSNCKIIVNGESIGQVASQTLTSMNAINRVVNIPVIFFLMKTAVLFLFLIIL